MRSIKKQTSPLRSNWLTILVVLVASLVLGVLIDSNAFRRGVKAEHQPAYNQGYQEGYDRGYQEAWKLGYNKGLYDGQAPYKLSTNATISLDEALAILELGKQNHLAWATRPDLIVRQDANTGDTGFNLMWAGYYQELIDFIK